VLLTVLDMSELSLRFLGSFRLCAFV